jgi:hypothetical protein
VTGDGAQGRSDGSGTRGSGRAGSGTTDPPPRRFDDEAKLFARMAAFGLVVGGGYWLLTYETAGTVLLLAFGLAAGICTLAIVIGARGAQARGRDRAPSRVARVLDAPLAGREAVPAPGWAPLGLAVGIGGLALGAAFGPWLVIGGLVVTLLAAWAWLGATVAETDRARDAASAVDVAADD